MSQPPPTTSTQSNKSNPQKSVNSVEYSKMSKEELISKLMAAQKRLADPSVKEELQRLRTQAVESSRAEQLLTLRLTNKQQQLQEVNRQLDDVKKGRVDGMLSGVCVDRAINLLFQQMREQIKDLKGKLDQAHKDLAAWKFTPDSQSGKRLMAKCRRLLEENEKLDSLLKSGREHELEGEVALQKEVIKELKMQHNEAEKCMQEMDDELENIQATIISLRHNPTDQSTSPHHDQLQLLEQELKTSNEEVERCRSELETSGKQFKETQEKLEETQEQLKQTQKQLKEAQQQLKETQQQLNQAQQQIKSLKQNNKTESSSSKSSNVVRSKKADDQTNSYHDENTIELFSCPLEEHLLSSSDIYEHNDDNDRDINNSNSTPNNKIATGSQNTNKIKINKEEKSKRNEATNKETKSTKTDIKENVDIKRKDRPTEKADKIQGEKRSDSDGSSTSSRKRRYKEHEDSSISVKKHYHSSRSKMDDYNKSRDIKTQSVDKNNYYHYSGNYEKSGGEKDAKRFVNGKSSKIYK